VKWRIASTTAEKMIRTWWGRQPFNVCVDCHKSGLLVIDEDAFDVFTHLCAANDQPVPVTYTTSTDKGRHFYFRYDHDVLEPIFNSESKVAHKVDVRGSGGFVIGAGSVHAEGSTYTVIVDSPVAQLPEWLATLLLNLKLRPRLVAVDGLPPDPMAKTSTGFVLPPIIEDGTRDSVMFRYASQLRNRSLAPFEEESLMRDAWKRCEQPPVAAKERPLSWAMEKLEHARRQYPQGKSAEYQPVRALVDIEPVPSMRSKLLSVTDLGKLPPVRPLVTGFLYQGTLAQLSGPPGQYKSFWSIGVACSVASGRSFEGHDTARGKVIYVAAEGATGARARILAWCELSRIDPADLDGWLYLMPEPIQLGNATATLELADLATEWGVSLAIFDTRARCTLGLEENSASDQGIAIDNAEQIIHRSGATVLAVHHSGREGAHGRGSTAWDGAVWSDLRMSGEELRATVKCAKHKDVPDG